MRRDVWSPLRALSAVALPAALLFAPACGPGDEGSSTLSGGMVSVTNAGMTDANTSEASGEAETGGESEGVSGSSGASGPECGDAVCEGIEYCVSCPADCGSCDPICGDGQCNGNEGCGDCPGDCGE